MVPANGGGSGDFHSRLVMRFTRKRAVRFSRWRDTFPRTHGVYTDMRRYLHARVTYVENPACRFMSPGRRSRKKLFARKTGLDLADGWDVIAIGADNDGSVENVINRVF